MKNFAMIVLLMFGFTVAHSQNNNLIEPNCPESGLGVTAESEQVNSDILLDKYLDMPIYKMYLKNGDNEAVEFGPSKTDLTKIFGGKNGDKGYYCLNDLPGLNFAAIQHRN